MTIEGISKIEKSEWNDSNINNKLFIPVAIFHVASTVTSNMSLQWISYPTQVVTKGLYTY